jgi:hypothetical protein
MPRKSKTILKKKQKKAQTEKKVQNEKKEQIETQSQNVRQNVTVKIGEETTKRRKQVRRRKPTRGGGGKAQFISQAPLGANVIYQSNQLTPIPFAPEPTRKITDAEPKKPTLLEDTGIVGTEGRGVRILELPTKREQLERMTAPIAKMEKTIPPKFEQKTPSLTMGLESDLPSFSNIPASEAPLNKMREPLNAGMIIPPLSEATEFPMSKEREDEAISAQAEKMETFALDSPRSPRSPRRIRKPRTEEQKERDRQRAREYRKKAAALMGK